MRQASFFSTFFNGLRTINIYFPAAAAEQVTDEIINDIQTGHTIEQKTKDVLLPQSKTNGFQRIVYLWLDRSINLLIPSAYAAEVDLSVDTVEIGRLRAAMPARFSVLKTFYSKGLIAINSNGILVARGTIPLKDRNKVKKLVAAENADRYSLYQAIANGHPEWFDQIKATFADRWIEHAQKGWWHQNSKDSWKQK
ncbi:MAG: YdbL family protein [Methylococcales bacterium]|nr:YdbL family protein [Methylococcales bacterium]